MCNHMIKVFYIDVAFKVYLEIFNWIKGSQNIIEDEFTETRICGKNICLLIITFQRKRLVIQIMV